MCGSFCPPLKNWAPQRKKTQVKTKMKSGDEKAGYCAITGVIGTLHGTGCAFPISKHAQWSSIHFIWAGLLGSLGVRGLSEPAHSNQWGGLYSASSTPDSPSASDFLQVLCPLLSAKPKKVAPRDSKKDWWLRKEEEHPSSVLSLLVGLMELFNQTENHRSVSPSAGAPFLLRLLSINTTA